MSGKLNKYIKCTKNQDGKIQVDFKCPTCGYVDPSTYRYNTSFRYILEPGVDVEKWLEEFKEFNYKINSTCKTCSNKAAWEIIFTMYEMAYSNDEYKLTVLKNIKRLVGVSKPISSDFKRMLEDRGIVISNKDINIWNMAIDECKHNAEDIHWSYRPGRWQENDTLNRVFGFLSKL